MYFFKEYMKEDLFNHLEQNDVCKILSCYNDKPKYIFQLLLLDKIHIPPELLNLIMHFYQVILVQTPLVYHNTRMLILNHHPTYNNNVIYSPIKLYDNTLVFTTTRFTKHPYSPFIVSWQPDKLLETYKNRIKYIYSCSTYGSIRDGYKYSNNFKDYFKITKLNFNIGIRLYNITIEPITDLSLFQYIQSNGDRYYIDDKPLIFYSKNKSFRFTLLPHKTAYAIRKTDLRIDIQVNQPSLSINDFTYETAFIN